MSIRLLEMYRVLKETGSLYLQCDPKISHYLKILLDNIFGIENFRNEIVWGYRAGGVSKRKVGFASKHDIILFYTKNYKIATFNNLEQKSYTPTLPEPHTNSGKKLNVKRDEIGKYRNIQMRDWWVDTGLMPNEDVASLFRNNREKVAYPTQKPLKLYQRMNT